MTPARVFLSLGGRVLPVLCDPNHVRDVVSQLRERGLKVTGFLMRSTGKEMREARKA